MNNKTIAVAIDRDKGSQSALKWTIDNLVRKGQIVYLLHVKIKQSFTFSQSNFSIYLYTWYTLCTHNRYKDFGVTYI